MFTSRVTRHAVKGVYASQSRSLTNGVAKFLQTNLWGKSNMAYVTYIVIGSIALEAIYGNLTTSLWESSNEGKLYHQVNWSKFKTEE